MANMQIAKIDQFKAVLNEPQIRAQIRNSLIENAGAFLSSMLDLYGGETSLQNFDPQKVAMECLKAASLKLPIVKSLGFAYVVPFKNVPTFVIGYKGLFQLAQRSGFYKTINAGEVYEGEITGEDRLSGMIQLDGARESDKVVGYFAYFKLLNWFENTLYMSREEVEAWAKRYSPSYGSKITPRSSEFDKMACKTVLRRLIGTYGIMSTEMQTAIMRDDAGKTTAQEMEQPANSKPIEPNYKQVDEETGELLDEEEPAPAPEEAPAPVKAGF